jgi:hypothetical protein
VVAALVDGADLDVADDALLPGAEFLAGQVDRGDAVLAAEGGGELGGADEHPRGVGVGPVASGLLGHAGVFDADAVGVAAGGVPGGVFVADALDDLRRGPRSSARWLEVRGLIRTGPRLSGRCP